MPLILTILTALPSITTGVQHLFNFIREWRTTALQTGEWTEEMEKLFMDALMARAFDPAYQPDKPNLKPTK